MNLQPKTTRRLALLWTLGIIVACAIPGSGLPTGPVLAFDKVVHLLMFIGFGGLWMHADARGSLRRRMGLVSGAGLLLALATEAGQYLLPLGRTADWFDVGADVVGLGLALAGYAAFRRFSPPPRNTKSA